MSRTETRFPKSVQVLSTASWAWMSAFFLLPALGIFAISFLGRNDLGEVTSTFTFDNFKRVAGFGLFGFESLYPLILLRSLLLALLVAAVCVVVALPAAFALAALKGRARFAGMVLLMIPFWTNLLIRTYAWQLLLAPEGWVSRLLQAFGLMSKESGLYPSLGAVLLGLVTDYLPFAVLPVFAAVEKLDWSLVDAARDLGAGAWSTFRHAIYPQLKAGMMAAALLVGLPATGQFVVPDLLGGGKTILLGNLLQQQFGASRDWPFGAAITVVAMLVVMASLWLAGRGARSAEGFGSGRTAMPSRKGMTLGDACVLGLLFATLYLPLLLVVVNSFNLNRHGFAWRGITLKWYGDLFADAGTVNALKNTLVVALVSTTLSTLLGAATGAALGLARRGQPWKDAFLKIQACVPDIVFAVALLLFFGTLRQWFSLFDLGLPTMILGHATFQLPFVIMVVRARAMALDPALEDAAHDLGADGWQTFRHVTLPLLKPSILAGSLLAFTLSLDDFVVSFFLGGPGSTTLPVFIYSSVKRGISPEINALSTLIILASAAATSLMMRLQQRHETNTERNSFPR